MLHRHLVTHSGPAPGRRACPVPCAVSILVPVAACLIALVSGTSQAGAEEPRRPKSEVPLARAVDAITESFRSGRTASLRPLLSPTGKVYISSTSLAVEPSFYSRDQAEGLLRQAFGRMKTLQFGVKVERSTDADQGEGLTICLATWRYVEKGSRKETHLRFLLARRGEGWALSEIRETR